METKKTPTQIASSETHWSERTAWILERLKEKYPTPGVAMDGTRYLAFHLAGGNESLSERFGQFLMTYGRFAPLNAYSAPETTFKNFRKQTCLSKMWGHPDDMKIRAEVVAKRDPVAYKMFMDQISAATERQKNPEAAPAKIDTLSDMQKRIAELERQVEALEARLSDVGG